MKMKKIRILSGFVFLFALLASNPVMASGAFPKPDSTWVDSVFNSLTADQRIAQLFIIRAFSDKDSVYNDSLTNVIRKWNPGGVCFFYGAVRRQASLTNIFQQHAQTPLLIAIDAEYGLGMRLDIFLSPSHDPRSATG
jgi:hypothetical protein